MFWLPVTIIIAWTVLWIARAINLSAKEQFYYKGRKLCKKRDRPFLFHVEFMLSLMWAALGFVVLFFFMAAQV